MHRRLVLPVVLLAAALAACSAPEPTGASGAAPATQLAEPDHTVLSANSTAKLGTVVIDGLGWTLYRFDADSAQPPKSATIEGRAIATTISSAPPRNTPRLANANAAQAATGWIRAGSSVTGRRG